MVDFKDDNSIQKVVFDSNSKYNIISIEGPEIKEIKLSGPRMNISSLCSFLDNKLALPKLRLLHLTNITIPNFKANQNCSGKMISNFIRDDPFQNTKLPTKNVEVSVTNYYICTYVLCTVFGVSRNNYYFFSASEQKCHL